MADKAKSCCFRTSIGGQALIEGILMRGPRKQAIVCRTQDGLVEKTEELKFIKDRYPILGWPFIRGCATFLDSMVKGMQALTYSAELVPMEEQGEPDKLDQWIEKHFPEDKAQKLIIGVAVAMGIALAVLLFVFLPAFIVGLIKPLTQSYLVRNLSEGLLRVVILLLYMRLCCCMSDIKRLFSYHGAEHKTIFCYEHGKPLTVENVREESRFHPRCGTSFLLVVVVVSILVNAVVRLDNTFARMGCHLLLLPVVVGISYEINRWCGRHDNWLSAILSAPGKWLQHMTTNEPDDSMIECAIRAMELVIPEEKGSDAW
ncbi:MAG: DUF1385 domain-containing protein [Candidatus Limivicinus sp.]|nr:DUF1385 domain-containing protein [Clostridiales bacterium]MDY6132421.1 DUF1385 domain-containing protein [Candidatus Limivicinus sp.]